MVLFPTILPVLSYSFKTFFDNMMIKLLVEISKDKTNILKDKLDNSFLLVYARV